MSPRDPIRKIRSVRLVPVDDPGYLAAMSEQALAHRHYGPKEEQAATYRVSGSIEAAVRAWLAERIPLLPERVVAAEVLYREARSYEPLFLELDAVEGRGDIPRRVFEVKFTSNLGAVRHGFGQAARAVRLLSSRYDAVEGVVVMVRADRGPLDTADPRLVDVTLIDPADLGTPRLAPRPLLCLPLQELAGHLSAEELSLLQSARDESDANVSARRERAALVEAGDEPPPTARRAPPVGATISFGDDAEDADGQTTDSPFAVLRDLSGRDPSRT